MSSRALGVLAFSVLAYAKSTPIDRKSVVQRHNPSFSAVNGSNVLNVGNGAFAFNFDITGTQTLNDTYSMYDLNTLSDWGFHSQPFSKSKPDDGLASYNYTHYTAASGREVRYPTESKSAEAVWLHANPHKLSLFQLSLRWTGPGNSTSPLQQSSLLSVSQSLDLWSGLASSSMLLQTPHHMAGLGLAMQATVQTVGHPTLDAVSLRLTTACNGSTAALTYRLAFPYATGAFGPSPNAWGPEYDGQHSTVIAAQGQGWAVINRTVDYDTYVLQCNWAGGAGVYTMVRAGPHALDLLPMEGQAAGTGDGTPLDLTCLPYPTGLQYPTGAWMPWMQEKIAATQAATVQPEMLPPFSTTLAASTAAWAQYWASGAFVDLASATQDAQAWELERRIVLSMYLLRVHSAGATPPAETGLLCNSWSGKFHLEMRAWHAGHWPWWGRPELLHRADGWMVDYAPNASSTATFQGYDGTRWPKMIAPVSRLSSAIDVPWPGMDYAPFPFNNGSTAGYGPLLAWESASGVGPLLVWQQPHTIWYAEAQRVVALAQGGAPAAAAVLAFHAPLVYSTADFLSSFPYYNSSAGGEYWLGPPLYGAEESGDPATIYNPGWEMAYFKWALTVAGQWRVLQGLQPVQQWSAVMEGLAPPPLDPLPPPGIPAAYGFNQFCPGAYVPPSSAHAEGGTTPCAPCTSHPSPAALHGFLNGAAAGVDVRIANATLSAILSCWGWGSASEGTNVWGWDFPLMALGMARQGWQPQAVVDMLLMPVLKNSYTAAGYNFQTPGLPAYMPGNGGLLLAIAGMVAGFQAGEGAQAGIGFPPGWKAQAEGFSVPLL